MILYNAKAEGISLRVTKFDDDLNVESSYLVTEANCECPQGHKPVCRHRKMRPALLPIVDTDEFYCYDTRLYYGASGPGRATPKALPSLVEPTIATYTELKEDQDIATEFGKLVEHAKATPPPPSKLLLEPEELPRIRRRI